MPSAVPVGEVASTRTMLAARTEGADHVEIERDLHRPAGVGGGELAGAAALPDLGEAAVGGGARGQTELGAVDSEVGLGVRIIHRVDDGDRGVRSRDRPARHRRRRDRSDRSRAGSGHPRWCPRRCRPRCARRNTSWRRRRLALRLAPRADEREAAGGSQCALAVDPLPSSVVRGPVEVAVVDAASVWSRGRSRTISARDQRRPSREEW